MITDCSAVAWTIATPAECYNPAMPKILALIAAIILLASPLTGSVRDAYADLNDVAKALGAATVKSIQYTGTGGSTRPGRASCPGCRGRSTTSRATRGR